MPSRLVIRGGKTIKGEVPASGAKNSCLPVMAASILTSEPVTIGRVPDISDVWVMADILRKIGVKVDYDPKLSTLTLNAANINSVKPPEHLVSRMNASFDVAGPLLSRFGEAEVAMPGGCKIGQRRVNYHISAFTAMGADVICEGGLVKAKAKTGRLKGARYIFPTSSVGATANAMMAAVLAEGTSVLENSAREPEVADLATCLIKMGAKISGVGTQTLTIEGVEKLHGTHHDIISDRIECGTFLLAGAITEGDVTVTDFDSYLLGAFLEKLTKANQEVIVKDNNVRVIGRRPIAPVEIFTAAFPGFPTDLHPPIVALLSLAEGTSVLQENIFSSRFMYVMELARLGADVLSNDNHIRVRGVKKLTGAPVDAPDLRAGGALLLAAFAAEGETVMRGVRYIDRGYQHFEERFRSLGADITRVNEPLEELEWPDSACRH